MHCRWSKLLALLPTLLALAASESLEASTKFPSPLTLRPIKLSDYESASVLSRRESEKFSDLDMKTQDELIFGSPGAHGQAVLAKMTLYAPDGLQMIMMERFEGLTSAVDCKGDDGTMSLTFKSKDAFEHALKTWTYINEKEEDKFLLIANHDGCGPDDQRQPYLINKVTEDTKKLTTYLSAKPAAWSEVAGSYELDFGHPISHAKQSSLRERGLWDKIKHVGDDIGNLLTGSADLDKSITFGVNAGEPGKRTNIYTDEKNNIAIDCINCYIQGSFSVTGHLKVHHFSIEDLSITANPSGFEAELELEATAAPEENPVAVEYAYPLAEFPIPDAGIAVPGIFELGAILSYEVGVGAQFRGIAKVDFGLKAQLPDSAHVTVDVSNPGDSSADGFQGAVTPIFEVEELSASVTLSAFSQPKLSFGVEVTGVGHADVALILKLPQVSATLEAAYEAEGVCSQEEGASKTGVKLESEVAIELDAAVEVGWGESKGAPALSQKLFGWSVPLYEHCFPISIPGLEKGDGGPEEKTPVPSSPPVPSLPPVPVSVDVTSSPPVGGIPTVSAPLGTAPATSVPIGTAPASSLPAGTAPVGTVPAGTAGTGFSTLARPTETPKYPTGPVGTEPVGTGTAPGGTGTSVPIASQKVPRFVPVAMEGPFPRYLRY